MLPTVLRWNKSVNAARQQLVARALGTQEDAAATIEALVSGLGLPTRLRDVGVRREHFDAIAAGAMQNVFVRSNPRPVTDPAHVLEMLEMAW